MSNANYQTVSKDGTTIWWRRGEFHNVKGPACIRPDGTEEWWNDGRLHRKNGPAVIHADGSKEWWFKGELHRLDGPAVIGSENTWGWWVNGFCIDDAVAEFIEQMSLPEDYRQWNRKQWLVFRIRFMGTTEHG